MTDICIYYLIDYKIPPKKLIVLYDWVNGSQIGKIRPKTRTNEKKIHLNELSSTKTLSSICIETKIHVATPAEI